MKIVCIINRAIVGKAIVYLNEDEYVVKFWRGKEFQRGAEYYTSCKEDAIGTARAQLQHWVDLEN